MALNPHNLRIVSPEPESSGLAPQDIVVEDAIENDEPNKVTDDKGNVIEIEHSDGSVVISLDGSSLEDASPKSENETWFKNLAENIAETELSIIAEDLLTAIDEDLESRKDWIDDRTAGIRLLGLKLETPGTGSPADGAPVEGMSKVRHPLLLEACLRFQANARSELLPTDGPVKIREDNNNANLETDELANDLENDLNHYLTSTASEYYPDTDRMLLMLGFGGSAFKKVYFCPLRNRPVSESVDADDLIVNNSATDLQNASRVTHRIMMKASTLKRMQIVGAYRNVEVGTPTAPNLDAVQREKANVQGVNPEVSRSENNQHEIYECYCELDLVGYEHKDKGKPTSLPLPYRVTIDKSSKTILSIVRNYDKTKNLLPVARETFVQYTFIPGFGFYAIGLLHILGNATMAVTAAWRELLDAGMFANFPGFLVADAGSRQDTNIFRVPPGGGAPVKTAGQPINQAIMPLPYKEPSAALMQLVENIATTGQRVGGTSEQAVGEGKQDAPVGTTLALIDQATKMINAAHKRMHTSQAKEFQLLLECFRENPESFWQNNKKPAREWDQKTFLNALDQYDLVPQADPNTASQTQRLMKIVALKQIQAGNPQLYDAIAIDKAALRAIGWSNPEQFFAPPEQQSAPPPQMQKEMAEMKIKQQDANSKSITAKARMLDAQSKAKIAGSEGLGAAAIDPLKVKALQLKEKDMVFKQQRAAVDDHNRDADRQADIALEKMRLEGELVHAQVQNQHERNENARQQMHEHQIQSKDLVSEHIRHAEQLMHKTDGQGAVKKGEKK